ncbi:hypothetical protein [Leptospira stimsonii]|nr:hypothetical protein [Leptospira stimsonii]
MFQIDPELFIGKTQDSKEVANFLIALNENPNIESFAEFQIWDFPRNGISFYLNEDQQVVVIFLFGSDDEEHLEFKGVLPRNISFECGSRDVAEKLGLPSLCGAGSADRGEWERFDFTDVSIHFEYLLSTKGIKVITLMSPSVLSGIG